MEQLVFEFIIILPISLCIGIVAALTGISGGAFKTPLLIILFLLPAEVASAVSLLSAVFVSVAGTLAYYRHNPDQVNFRIGLFLVIATLPGTSVGIFLRTIFADAHILRSIFGIVLFPIALKMMMSLPIENDALCDEEKIVRISQLSLMKIIMIIFAAFLAGILAGLLGLGGGTLIVPALCIILNFPILAAAATSMFTMIFTTSVGSLINYIAFIQTDNLIVFLYYGLVMGTGMVTGGFIGPKYANRVDGLMLQRLFGFILIFALVKMMSLGQLWFNPEGSSFLLATIGDSIIWLLIGIPLLMVSFYRIRKRRKKPANDFEIPYIE